MYNKSTLSNGIRVVTEKITHFSAVSVGIWIDTGSRNEDMGESGISHFIEHMLFKGTNKRSASQIAREIDSVGGVLNAFTSKECTCLYVKILDEYFSIALDLLSDIFLCSLFDLQEVEKEKEVIFQEISMTEDNPEEYVHELFVQSIWGGCSLGRSPLGTVDTVRKLSRDKLIEYFKKNYFSERIIIAAAGNVDHDNLVELMEGALGTLPEQSRTSYNHLTEPEPEICIKRKDLEQVHICLGTKAPSTISPKKYAGFILNTVLGGNMSSRLFQEIRENRGLAYSIYSYQSSFMDTGLLGVYAGTGEDTTSEVLFLILQEFKKLKEEEIEEKELNSAKEYLKGNLVIALDSVDSRMSRLAKNEMHFNRRIPVHELIAEIEKVSAAELTELANEIFIKKNIALTLLGKIDEKEIRPEILNI